MIFFMREFFTFQNKSKWYNQTTLEQVGNYGKQARFYWNTHSCGGEGEGFVDYFVWKLWVLFSCLYIC
jgi:hypothetical protein